MHVSFGSVSATGGIENPGSGDWAVQKADAGRFRIAVDTTSEAFPVVIATGSITGDDLASDNVVTVQVESTTTFVVASRDVAGWEENQLQDAAFSFVAYWP
jgi:hypothetical protein